MEVRAGCGVDSDGAGQGGAERAARTRQAQTVAGRLQNDLGERAPTRSMNEDARFAILLTYWAGTTFRCPLFVSFVRFVSPTRPCCQI